jgi:formate-dependent nitrite reductase membrane component NrfD
MRRNYYSLPVLKPAHWKWEIVLYFWLGGIAAGSYVVAAIADVLGNDEDRATARAGRLIAFPLLLVCPLLLIKDLGRPERFYNMLRIFKLKSPMSVGSWALFVFGGFTGLSALLEMPPLAGLGNARRFGRLLGLLGAPVGLVIGGYTGILISATAVPLWWRNRLLWGPLFLASAFSTGVAAIETMLSVTRSGGPGAWRRLSSAHLFGLLLEAGLLVASIRRLGRAGDPLVRGRWSSLFLPGVAGVGLAAPILLSLSGREGGRGMSTVRALCVLLGGLVLRTCVVYAGRDSVEDPTTYLQPNS